MSSGKFCCKSWRKLLVPGTCPTPLLEVNYCFSCTAKTTCASIPAAPAHSPTPSSAPASSSRQTAPRHGLCSAFAPLSSSRLGGERPHAPAALAAGLMAASLYFAPRGFFRSVVFQQQAEVQQPDTRWKASYLTTLQRQNTAFHSILPPNRHFSRGLGGLFSFLCGVDVMQRRKDRMRTWQKCFLLPDRHRPARGLQSNSFPSVCFSIPVYNKWAGIILDHFLLLQKNLSIKQKSFFYCSDQLKDTTFQILLV